jgi:hypothetical protein
MRAEREQRDVVVPGQRGRSSSVNRSQVLASPAWVLSSAFASVDSHQVTVPTGSER